MYAVQLADRDLLEVGSDADATRRIRFDFPLSSMTGAASSALVYFELEPGEHTGVHTDSAEEVLVILSGTVEAIVGDERGTLAAGGVGLVPALVQHDVRNVGAETARVAGFFSSSTVVSVFDDPFTPFGKSVVGTPIPEEAGSPSLASAG